MIVDVVLCVVAWAVAGAAALPVDPFLPLGVGIALRPDWSRARRLVLAGALGPIAAALTADDAVARTATYAAAVLLATEIGGGLRDRVGSRVALAAAVGLGTLVMGAGLAVAAGRPPHAALAPAVVGGVAWTAMHAALGARRREGVTA